MLKLTFKRFVKVLCTGTLGMSLVLSAGCGAKGNGGSSAGAVNTDVQTIKEEGQASNVTDATEITDTGVTITEDGKTKITCAWDTVLTSLAPFQQATSPKQAFQYEALETFMALDYNYELVPVVAKSYKQIDEDGYKWEIELFDYVHDWEGNHITADDAVFCINEARNQGFILGNSDSLEDVKKTGEYTFEIDLNTNFYGTIESMLAYTPILSQKAYEESPDGMATSCVYTGPYKVTDFVNGAYITTEAVDDYWQTDEKYLNPYGHQNVDIIHKVFITENSQREVLLENGEVNVVYNIDTSSIKQFEGNDNILYKADQSRMDYVLIPSARGVFADPRLRQAMAYAINEQALIDAAYDGYGYKINHGLTYTTDYNPEWDNEEYYSYDPEKAKELVKEAGAEGTKVLLMTTASAGSVPEYVQMYLNAAGFDCEIQMLELAAYMKNYWDWSTYDLTTGGVQGSSTIEFYKWIYDTDETGTNATGFNDPKLNDLMKTASTTAGHTPENMENLHDYLVEQCYRYTPITFCQINMWRNDSGIVDLALDYNLAPRLGSCTYVWNK